MSLKRPAAMRAYLVLAAVTFLGALVYIGYGLLTGNQVSTDNAQLETAIVPLAPRVGGTILRVHVKDNQKVEAGSLIAEIDPRDYQIQVAKAEADLEAAEAKAETAKGQKGADLDTAQEDAAEAQLLRAEADLRKAQRDVKRARRLKAQKATTPVDVENAENALARAKATVEQARAGLRLAKEQHGVVDAKVKSAKAALEQARAQLEDTKIHAPSAGTLSRIAVLEGQIVKPGQTIAMLVGSDAYLVANFKETQIGHMHPGQRAEITIDAYPDRHFEGRVQSLAAATGARFSLLPPDNASGNFVKVVQRVPVRISLDDRTKEEVDLKAGLSADVTIFLE